MWDVQYIQTNFPVHLPPLNTHTSCVSNHLRPLLSPTTSQFSVSGFGSFSKKGVFLKNALADEWIWCSFCAVLWAEKTPGNVQKLWRVFVIRPVQLQINKLVDDVCYPVWYSSVVKDGNDRTKLLRFLHVCSFSVDERFVDNAWRPRAFHNENPAFRSIQINVDVA